jgi:thiosulfate/3-mercaptopyruvate sulfurtransferase
MAEVLAAVEQPDPGTVILDVREWPEFSGAIQAPGAARRGRVPGAVWLYWADTLNGDQTLKTTGELKQLFAAKGITPDKRVIIYCQAGVRAAHTSYVLSELIEYKQVQNYAGSWAEWSQNRELPVDSGQIAVNK